MKKITSKPAVKKRPDPKKKPSRKKKAPRKPRGKKAAPGIDYPVELLGEVARDWWRRLESDLRNRLNLLSVDRGALILLCNSWQRLAEVQAVLAKAERYPVTGENGYQQIHPAAVDEHKLNAQIRQLQAELGMSIKARKGVRVKSGDGDPLKAFLAGAPQ
jgi:P27 family predicted phage terminase small subunit